MNEKNSADMVEAVFRLAEAIESSFSSPNEPDSNFENANIVDAIAGAGRAIKRGLVLLGNADAATPMGGLEAHGKAILDAADKIAMAIESLAGEIRWSSRRAEDKVQ